MYYTIKKMAEQLGVTTNKLRYYERMGLIEPHTDQKTGYRYYSVRDTRRFNATRLYRAYGLSIQECKDLMENDRHDELMQALDRQEAALQKQIDYEMDKMQALLYWKPFISSVLQDHGKARLVSFPTVYRIAISLNEEPYKDEARSACFNKWLELFPVCNWASRIKQESFENPEIPEDYDYGLIMQERFFHRYPQLAHDAYVERIEGGKYVYSVFEKMDDAHFRLNGYDVMAGYMQAHRLRVAGDGFSNCLYSTKRGGKVVNYHYFIIKVAEDR